MKIWKRYPVIGCVVLLVTLCGCLGGAKPDIVSEDKKEGQAYSSNEVRTMTVDRPFMLSGDYFLKRDYPQGTEKAEAKSARTSQNPSFEENQKSAEKRPALFNDEPDRLPIGNRKIGLLVLPKDLSSPGAQRLISAARQAAAGESTLIGPDELANDLSEANCRQKEFLSCLGDQAALYPGVQMLVAAGPANLPGSFPGSASLECRVMDTGLGYVYAPLEMVQTLENTDDVDRFLDQALQRALRFARRKAEVMPLYFRVFSVQQGRIYINSGASAGVSVGDEFDVVSSGQMVDTPAGLPVAWEPNAPKARIRVEKLLRNDISACSMVKGQSPNPGAYVLPAPAE